MKMIETSSFSTKLTESEGSESSEGIWRISLLYINNITMLQTVVYG
jgi:hypothetical protein